MPCICSTDTLLRQPGLRQNGVDVRQHSHGSLAMSEYQYYEFQAVDRPLSKREMAELRALSTRATITPTRFVNFYNWGNFRGNPSALMETYFDAFVYVANWGTHELMLRLPRRLLDPGTASRYCVGEGAR